MLSKKIKNFSSFNFGKIKSKKAISGVLTTVILIAMVVVLIGILWYVIKPMIERNIAHASACSPEIIGKISLNRLNTCYKEETFGGVDKKIMKVSVEIKDLEYDKIIVYISTGGESKKEEIKGQEQNSGKTYEYDMTALGLDEKPDTIKISPVINGEQCDVIDSINDVATCP